MMKVTYAIVRLFCATVALRMTYIEPVDVLVPVGLCDRCVGDVWLLRIVLGIAVWLRLARHWGWLFDVVGVNGLHASDSLVGRHGEVAIGVGGGIARGIE